MRRLGPLLIPAVIVACSTADPVQDGRPDAPVATTAVALEPSGSNPSRNWSKPSRVRGMPSGHVLRSPSITILGDTLYAAGNTLPVNISDSISSPSAIILRQPGMPLEMPPGDFLFVQPKLLVASDRTIHLFWAEPQSSIKMVVSREWPPRALSSVWYATYTGSQWSDPVRLLENHRVAWGSGSNAALDSRGRPHLVVPGTGLNSRPQIVHLSWDGMRWRHHVVGAAASYASVLRVNGDSVVVAYSGLNTTDGNRRRGVFVLRKSNADVHWTDPQFIPLSNYSDWDANPSLIGGDSGRVHLLWSVTGPEQRMSLEHFYTLSSGLIWQRQATALLPTGMVPSITLEQDKCGGIVAVAEVFNGLQLQLVEVVWPGADVSIRPLFSSYAGAGSPALHFDGERLVLLWSGVEGPADTAVLFTSERFCGAAEPEKRGGHE